ncbi:MAG TPA: CHAT domain-containing protein [Thermoanaerobaculia bacterium]|nr:CHAT domain-containing protein [Thermoanaerobaculia bacterium]
MWIGRAALVAGLSVAGCHERGTTASQYLSEHRPLRLRVAGQTGHEPCEREQSSIFCARDALTTRGRLADVLARGRLSAADEIALAVSLGTTDAIARAIRRGAPAGELDPAGRLNLSVAYAAHAERGGDPFDLIRALALLDELVEVSDMREAALFDRATCLALLGRFQEARRDALELAAADGDTSDPWAVELESWLDEQERELAHDAPAARARSRLEHALFLGDTEAAVPVPGSAAWQGLREDAKVVLGQGGDRYWDELLAELERHAARGASLEGVLGSLRRARVDRFSLDCQSAELSSAERESAAIATLAAWFGLERTICAYYSRDFSAARMRAGSVRDLARARDWRYLEARADWIAALVETLAGEFQAATLLAEASRRRMIELGELGLAAYLGSLQARNHELAGAWEPAWRYRAEGLRGLLLIESPERRQSVLDEAVAALRDSPYAEQARHFLGEDAVDLPPQVRLLRASGAVHVALDRGDTELARADLDLARASASALPAGHPNRPRLGRLIDVAGARLERQLAAPAESRRLLDDTIEQVMREPEPDLQLLYDLENERIGQLLAADDLDEAIRLLDVSLQSWARRLVATRDAVARVGLAGRYRLLAERQSALLLRVGLPARAGAVLDAARLPLTRLAPGSAIPRDPDAAALGENAAASVLEVWQERASAEAHLWIDRGSTSEKFQTLSVSETDQSGRPALHDAVAAWLDEQVAPHRDVYLVLDGLDEPEALYSLLVRDQRRRVSVVPAVWLLERAMAANRDKRARGSETLLVVADPQLGDQAALPRLQHARREASAIVELYAEHESLVGPEATVAGVVERWGAPDVIHLAAHGTVLGKYDPGPSLVLSPPAGEARAFELWPAASMPDARPDARQLAVLASCRGAGSAWEAGGSLAAELLAKGYATVIASPGDLDDATSSEVFAAFHRRLGEGADSFDALRGALEERWAETARDADVWHLGLFEETTSEGWREEQ